MIYLGALGALIQYVPLWEKTLTLIGLWRKPFNCALCFTWWCSIMWTAYAGLDLSQIIFTSAGAAVLAELLNRKLWTI